MTVNPDGSSTSTSNSNNGGDTSSTSIASTVALGAGCYWGTEKYIRKDFQQRFPNSIKSATVGFMSPDPNAMKNPSYRQVCSGSTGHVEVLQVELNDPQLFEELIKFFFLFHDPTTKNRQGNDVGTQYASYIFTNGQQQQEIANRVVADLETAIETGKVKKYLSNTVTTKVAPAQTFYPAHEEHQEYLMKNPNGYCNHYFRIKEFPSSS